MMMRSTIRLMLLAVMACVAPASAGLPSAPTSLPEYMLFAQRRLETRVNTPVFHGNVGVNCPFSGDVCGIALFDLATFADDTTVVAGRVVPRVAGSTMFRVFGTLEDPGDLLEIRDPAPTPDGTFPFTGPILPDLDGDDAPSCSNDCTVDPGDLERACGFTVPFPSCDLAVRVIARRNRDCSAGVDLAPGNGRCDLAPGVYGEVTVRGKATLVLAGGSYTMCDLEVGKRGEVTTTVPTLVNVAGGVVKVKRRGALGRTIGQIAIHKKGAGQVRVDPLGSVTGRICAPEATIALGRFNRPGPALYGQFIGDVITVDGDFSSSGTDIDGPDTCDSDAECNDGEACGASSCVECTGCTGGAFEPACCNYTGGSYCSDTIPQPCYCAVEGESCDDSDACTLSDTCDGSLTCAGTETLACDDENVCTDDSCDPQEGCTATPNTASCDDGNACTEDDECAGGSCAPGTAINCNDGIACTIDSCDPEEGCVHTPVGCPCDADADCADDDPCTETSCDTENHVCESTPVACACDVDADCEDDDPCTETSCDPELKVCESTPVACACESDVDCEDDDPCTVTACDPELKVCESAAAANGTSCADADPCDGAETCTAGVCGGGTALVCNDGNPCTTDACTTGVGCTTAPNDGATCTDGDSCNGDEVCSGGACLPGTPPSCFGALACTFADPLIVTGECPEKMKARFEKARTLAEAGRGRTLEGKDRAAIKRLKKAFRVLRKMAKRAGLLEACTPVTARAESARDVVGGIRSNFESCAAELRSNQ